MNLNFFYNQKRQVLRKQNKIVHPWKEVIVKVQLSINTTADERQMMLYTQDRLDVFQEGAATKFVKGIMGSKKKAYFHARTNGKECQIGELAIDQSW